MKLRTPHRDQGMYYGVSYRNGFSLLSYERFCGTNDQGSAGVVVVDSKDRSSSLDGYIEDAFARRITLSRGGLTR